MVHKTFLFPDSREADRLFALVFQSLTKRSVDVSSLRMLTQVGMPHAASHLASSHAQFVQDLLTTGEFKDFFTDREAVLALSGGAKGMAHSITANQLRAYQMTVDAASVVFAHAAVDAAASDLCWITAYATPTDWEPYLANRTVSLADVKSLTYDELLSEKLKAHLERLEREALHKRVDRIFALCQPDSTFETVRGFRFDSTRLRELDRLRQDVVHHTVEDGAFADIEQDLDFLTNSGLHLWGLVNHRYGVMIDVRDLVGIPIQDASK